MTRLSNCGTAKILNLRVHFQVIQTGLFQLRPIVIWLWSAQEAKIKSSLFGMLRKERKSKSMTVLTLPSPALLSIQHLNVSWQAQLRKLFQCLIWDSNRLFSTMKLIMPLSILFLSILMVTTCYLSPPTLKSRYFLPHLDLEPSKRNFSIQYVRTFRINQDFSLLEQRRFLCYWRCWWSFTCLEEWL